MGLIWILCPALAYAGDVPVVGTVLDEDGEGIAGVSVYATCNGMQGVVQARTSQAGTFRFSLPAGRCDIDAIVGMEGHKPLHKEVGIRGDEATAIRVRFVAKAPRGVILVDAKTNPGDTEISKEVSERLVAGEPGDASAVITLAPSVNLGAQIPSR